MNRASYAKLAAEAKKLILSRKFGAAETACARLCKNNPGRVTGWLLLGRVYKESGAFDKALECGQRARELQPASGEAHIITGYAYLGKDLPEDACKCFHAAIKLVPDNFEAHFGMGVALHSNNQFREALFSYTRVIELYPESMQAHYNCGLTRVLLGEYDDAINSFRTAGLIDPEWPEPVIACAEVYEKKGNYTAAAKLLTPLIDDSIKNANAGALYARLSAHYGKYDQAKQYLDSLLAMDSFSDKDRMSLHFSLGLLYEKSSCYDDAFRHYQAGNTLHGNDYNPEEDLTYFNHFMEVCSRSALNAMSHSTLESGVPVFIIGMPRSGTSLVEKILAKHPDVAGGGELGEVIFMTGLVARNADAEREYPDCLNGLTARSVNDYVRTYLSALRKVSGTARRVTNKMPHNFLHLAFIRMLFPAAPIIHCVRQPLDTCLSCYFQCFNGNILPYTYDLSYMGQHYRNYQRLMKHWKNDVGISMLDVKYEELVNDQEGVSRKIIEYCGLEWDAVCLEFYNTEDKTLTASYDQVRHPIYSTSTGRWKHYEKHLQPLVAALGVSPENELP